MKKILIYLLILSTLPAFLTSCGEDPKNEWLRFYGFTKDDILGHYEANPDESLYVDLPTEGVDVYSNATLEINPLSGNQITVRIVIPDVLSKIFSGNIEDDEMAMANIILRNYNDEIFLYVFKNDEGNVRIHGQERRYTYGYDEDGNYGILDSNFYGFDVIKQNN